jgi:hypothetical protein
MGAVGAWYAQCGDIASYLALAAVSAGDSRPPFRRVSIMRLHGKIDWGHFDEMGSFDQ